MKFPRPDGTWPALDKSVKDASIRNLVQAIQDGLKGAVERKDIHGVKFATKLQLDVVDVLEQYFVAPNLAALVDSWPIKTTVVGTDLETPTKRGRLGRRRPIRDQAGFRRRVVN